MQSQAYGAVEPERRPADGRRAAGFAHQASAVRAFALLAVGVGMVSSGSGWARGFGFVALIFACVNIFGGFLVTQRMLAMYKKKAK